MNRFTLLALAALLAGCAVAPAPAPTEEVRWSGVVEVTGRRTLPRGTRLVIEPGTVVRFAYTDLDSDGLGDSSLSLEAGSLTARGTLEKPILFTGEGAAPGSWGEVRLDFGKVDLAYAVVEGSTRGLHLHFTSGLVEDSIFRSNVDSTRLGESAVRFSRCLFSQNTGKGFNARASANEVMDSWFRGNRRGLFLFELDRGSRFERLYFSGNETPVRLGDFFEGEVTVSGSAGSVSAPEANGPGGYLSDPGQRARLTWTETPARPVGPSGWPLLEPLWEAKLSGFVDADPVADERGVYAADWSGGVYRHSLLTGELLASGKVSDTVDAAPALSGSYVAVQDWGRKISLLDASTLATLDSFAEDPSPADDHRQSSPILSGGRLFAATWAGRVRGFETAGGRLRELWRRDLGSPVRAGLTLAGETLLAATEGGELVALTLEGRELWRARCDAPLLSTPAIDGARVFAGSKDGKLTALSLSDGKRLWSAELCGPAWYAPPALIEGALLQGDDAGCVTGFDPATGEARFRVKLDGAVRSRPADAGGAAAVTTLGGSLYLLDPSTGFVRDRVTYPEPLQSSGATLGGLLWFGGRDGNLRGARVVLSK